jgi:hypothetical protein
MPTLAVLFTPFGFLVPKNFWIIRLSNLLDFERITETRHAHLIRCLLLHYYHWVDSSLRTNKSKKSPTTPMYGGSHCWYMYKHNIHIVLLTFALFEFCAKEIFTRDSRWYSSIRIKAVHRCCVEHNQLTSTIWSHSLELSTTTTLSSPEQYVSGMHSLSAYSTDPL